MGSPGSNGDHIMYTRETDHILASVSKSVTSVIFGAAKKAGYIGSLDQELIEALPDYSDILIPKGRSIPVSLQQARVGSICSYSLIFE